MKNFKETANRKGFKEEHAEWTYPLHMIDFETSMVAIPFHAGRRPYEQMAFQYSHHTIDKDGRVEHKSQFLHVKRGEFPNYEFVRALKKDLEQDEGTIFRYVIMKIHYSIKSKVNSMRVQNLIKKS